jgi:hypothetical protein
MPRWDNIEKPVEFLDSTSLLLIAERENTAVACDSQSKNILRKIAGNRVDSDKW